MGRRRRPAAGQHQAGQVLPLALVFLALAVLLLGPLGLFISTAAQTEARVATDAERYYAAAAGIERVLADLVRGADAVATDYDANGVAISTSYTLPSVQLNELVPAVTIAAADGARPPARQQYVDPGVTDPLLHVVEPGAGYLWHMYHVQGSLSEPTTLEVNVAYDPAANIRIGVWRDVLADDAPGRITSFPTEQPILDRQNAGGNATFTHAGPLTIDTTGIYSFAVLNISDPPTTVTARPFTPSGGNDDTWIYVAAFRDYEITSTVEDVTIRAYVRQTPGFVEPPPRPSRSGAVPWASDNISWITHTINIYSWERP